MVRALEETTVGQSNGDTAITSETKQLYFSVIDSTLLELDARFGERCKPVTTLGANGNDFLDVKKMKPLLKLIPDPIIENDLYHKIEVAKSLILSKSPKDTTSSKTLLRCRKLSLRTKRRFHCCSCASTVVCVRRAFTHLQEHLLHTDGQCSNNV